MIQKGLRVVYGIVEKKPIVNLPLGKSKVVMRHDQFAVVLTRNSGTIARYIIVDEGDKWGLREIKRIEKRPNGGSVVWLK